MRRRELVAVWVLISLLGTKQVCAFPQESGQQEQADKQENAKEMQRGQKTRTSYYDGEDDSAVTIPHTVPSLAERFLMDQKQIWTSPTQLGWTDVNWLVPFSGITAGFFVTDAGMSRHISHNPTTVSHYNTLSDVAVGALLGGAGAMFFMSYAKHEPHWRETGFLAGEAAINSLVVVEAMKYPLGRQRPYQGNGNGDFFKGGVSFPSEHAAAAWAAAGVVAHEYPGPLTKILAYGLAGLVDYSRYRARQHFPSDIFIGSAIGNMVAENIYTQHHDIDLGGDTWNSFRSHLREVSKHPVSTANMGSPYVPLDSWVYPSFERLAAWGYVKSEMLGMRPWTRIECARLVGEVSDRMEAAGTHGSEASRLYGLLLREFSNEMELGPDKRNESAQLESVYARATEITGQPLRDNFHFGQTILNDYGRPYGEGLNSIAGFSGWATEGTLVAYVQAEYQQAGSSPALPLAARQAIAHADEGIPTVPPAVGTPAVSQFELMNAYLGMNIHNWQLSFGKQSLWLGTDDFGAMLMTNNIAPINMFLVSRVTPFTFPSVFRYLGPFRLQAFLGQLTGQNFVVQSPGLPQSSGLVGQWGQPLSRQPFLQGYKLSFKPIPNVEIGFTGQAVFGGGYTPLTLNTYLHSLDPQLGNKQSDLTGINPSAGYSGFDFAARVPKFERWLTFTFDSFSVDEFSCLNQMQKCAFEAGLYMPQVPGIPKLDLRVEGGTTQPVVFPGCIGCMYTNGNFPQSYTSGGNLIGTWIGRGAQGEQALGTYWLTERNKIQVDYRHRKIDGQFIAGGGSENDFGISTSMWFGSTVEMTGSVQYEIWNIPVLAPRAQSDVATSVGITIWPHKASLSVRSSQ